MASLWGDGWFYLSGGGFLVSSLLFVFLLGQYRAAIEAEEETEEAEEAAAAPAERVYVPRAIEPIASPKLASIGPAPRQEEVARPATLAAAPSLQAPAAEKAAEKKKSESSTGGISPAVVYLQSLKGQIEHMDKELGLLKGLASQQSAQGELILKRLAELTQRLADLEAAPITSGGAAAAALAPEPPPESETPISQVPVAAELEQPIEAAPAAEPAPVVEPPPAEQPEDLKTIVLEPPPDRASQPQEPPAEEKPARKGPVWPI